VLFALLYRLKKPASSCKGMPAGERRQELIYMTTPKAPVFCLSFCSFHIPDDDALLTGTRFRALSTSFLFTYFNFPWRRSLQRLYFSSVDDDAIFWHYSFVDVKRVFAFFFVRFLINLHSLIFCLIVCVYVYIFYCRGNSYFLTLQVSYFLQEQSGLLPFNFCITTFY
jgi:hypothetical protein